MLGFILCGSCFLALLWPFRQSLALSLRRTAQVGFWWFLVVGTATALHALLGLLLGQPLAGPFGLTGPKAALLITVGALLPTVALLIIEDATFGPLRDPNRIDRAFLTAGLALLALSVFIQLS